MIPSIKKQIDEILLKNGFSYYDDWEYGPITGWSEDFDHVSIKLFEHDKGYWIIFSRHASGANKTMNIGDTSSAVDILSVVNSLKNVKSTWISDKIKSERIEKGEVNK